MGFPHRGDKNKLCHLKQKGSSVRFCPHWSPPGASGNVQRFSALQMHLWTQSWWHLCKKRYIKHSLPCFFYLLHRRGQHSWSFTLYCHKHFRFCFCPVSFPQPCIHVALEVPWVFPLSITGLLLLQVFNPAGLLRLFLLHPSFSWKYLHCHNSIQIFRAANRQLLKTLCLAGVWRNEFCGLARVALGCFLPIFLPIKCLDPQ